MRLSSSVVRTKCEGAFLTKVENKRHTPKIAALVVRIQARSLCILALFDVLIHAVYLENLIQFRLPVEENSSVKGTLACNSFDA